MSRNAVAFILFLMVIPLAWAWISGKLKRKGWHWFLRHLVAAPLAFFIGLCVFGAFDDLGVAAFLGVFGGFVVYLIVRQWQVIEARPVGAPPIPEVPACPPAPALPERGITGESKKNPQKPEVEDPLARWKALDTDVSTSNYGPVADIEFDYRDAKGNDSHRRVAVEAVNREYFQGYCHRACATRTFVIGRVRGKVLDLDTGELIAPKTWATEARKHPLNDPDLISFDKEEGGWDEDNSEKIEICFTGFSKEDRVSLESQAELLGMRVRKSVTVGLTHLCTGPNAGPKKIEQAMDVGAEIIDEADFYGLRTGY